MKISLLPSTDGPKPMIFHRCQDLSSKTVNLIPKLKGVLNE